MTPPPEDRICKFRNKNVFPNQICLTDFLSIRFYVKLNFGESRNSKPAVFAIFGALNFIDFVNFSLQKVQKYMEIKIQSL